MSREASEAAVAAIVVAHLERSGHDVYQEVALSRAGGAIADIVSKLGAEIWIVEVKTSLSLALVIQAMDRRRAAHRVVIAAPYSRNANDVGTLCAELGIGLWLVRGEPSWRDQSFVEERVDSARHARGRVALAARLAPQHKTHAQAGAPGAAGRWTPWLNTCEQLVAVVRANPGITLKAAIDSVNHHYSSKASARGSLAKWISTGKVPGIAISDGVLRLSPTTAAVSP